MNNLGTNFITNINGIIKVHESGSPFRQKGKTIYVGVNNPSPVAINSAGTLIAVANVPNNTNNSKELIIYEYSSVNNSWVILNQIILND